MPHLIWEAVLLLAAIALSIVAISEGHFFGARNPLWPQIGLTGLVAAGFALSLRVGAPNLGIGAAAMLAGIVYGETTRHGWVAPAAVAVGVLAAVGLGLFLAVVAGLTGLPAWAVSLAGLAIGLTVAVGSDTNGVIGGGAGISRGLLEVVSAVVVLGSVGGGLLWLVPGVRSLRYGAQPGGTGPGIGMRMLAALLGLAGSSLLAGLGGALSTGYLRFAAPGTETNQTLVPVAVVLLGGASLARRSFGVAGTALAVYVWLAVENEVTFHGREVWIAFYLPLSLAIVVGLLAGWLLDRLSDRGASTPAYQAPPGPTVPPPPYAFAPQPPQQTWQPPPQQTWPAAQQAWTLPQQPVQQAPPPG